MTTRRAFLASATALGGTALASSFLPSAALAQNFEITHSEADWKKMLSKAEYKILRQKGTERPGSSELNREKRAGTFHCKGCDLPLYSSETKYMSGTGWPSFWAPIDNAVLTRPDNTLFMKRTEVICRRCGSHLGHVFEDGPKPTGLRYCMNGLAMTFKPA